MISERELIAKVSLRLIPFMFLLYIVSYLDRVNVSFASLQMNAALGFSAEIYSLGAGIFFIAYFIFEVPSNLILHRVGARLWIARIMITWGVISSAMMFVKGPISFYVLRFLLGVAEAGFFPGMILYLTYWFPNETRGRAVAQFNRNRGRDRKPDIRAPASIKRRGRTGRMAMVVLDRGHAVHSARIRHVGVLAGRTRQSIVAYCRREKVDRRSARAGTRTRLRAASRLDTRSNGQQPRLDVRRNLFRNRDELLWCYFLASANRESFFRLE
jgi:Major Facilitator Superfamily